MSPPAGTSAWPAALARSRRSRRSRSEVAPQTLLAAVQEAWPEAAGAAAAAQGDPVAERDGVVTIACRSATWAQELDLMSPDAARKARRGARSGPFARGPRRGSDSPPDAARGDPLTSVTVLCLFAGLLWLVDADYGPSAWYPYVNSIGGPRARPRAALESLSRRPGSSREATHERSKWQKQQAPARPSAKKNGTAKDGDYTLRRDHGPRGPRSRAQAPGHVHRLDRPARPPPPRLRGRRQLRRRGARRPLRPHPGHDPPRRRRSPSSTTAAASPSTSTRRRSGPPPRSS